MTDRALLQQALEALVSLKTYAESAEPGLVVEVPAITALKERLAQPNIFSEIVKDKTQRTHWEGCEEVHPECRNQKPPVKTYCGGKPNYCTPEQEPVAHCEAGPAHCPVCLKELSLVQEQEPVAWSWEHDGRVVNAFPFKPDSESEYWKANGWTTRPLVYGDTAPQRREWQGLTDEEFQWIYDNGRTPAGMIEMVEAKLREKNNA